MSAQSFTPHDALEVVARHNDTQTRDATARDLRKLAAQWTLEAEHKESIVAAGIAADPKALAVEADNLHHHATVIHMAASELERRGVSTVGEALDWKGQATIAVPGETA